MKKPSPAAMADSSEFPPPAPPNHRKKKTRELPNLSDCHCCNRRINCTNPKNRLQILASEWRIVLLCKSCYNLVESSQYCSYCLIRVSTSSMESCYECKKCRRRIHKDCVPMFSFGSGNISSSDVFSVCFDCWIPNLLENEYNSRVIHSRSKGKEVKCGGELTNSLGSSGVCDSQDKGKGLEGVMNDAHVLAQKKIAAALEAKEKALDKAIVAKRAVVLASSAVGVVAVNKEDDQRGSMIDDDAQLAFRLHRAMNSSRRILRNSCLLNTHCVDVPEVNGSLDEQAAVAMNHSSKPLNIRGDEQNGLLETRQRCEQNCARPQDEKHGGDFGGCLITYTRKGRASLEGKCKEEPDFYLRTYSEGCSSGGVRVKEEPESPLRTYCRRLSKVKRRKLELGHCSKTYSRRHSAIPHFRSKLSYGHLNLDNRSLAPAVDLEISGKSRAFTAS
ncbi:uncharacterized protein LOC104890531 isoform X1 [Beta vulgaris subsp. vulgaris]|uniref:uncharacterized protein LOC104890531 isoform X1 n=1 Tax=Beta vulgaris subsp. vulgaris TaxID=3555 RepID=UPI00203716C9|nr:uncharacterized protein LOC104890531 isoform X1 [Beta vulgaris subsp. vulgaris]